MVDSHIAKVNYILHRQMPVLERYAWQTPLSAKKGRICVYLEESRGGGYGTKERISTRTEARCEELVDGVLMIGRKEGAEMRKAIEGSIEGEIG